MRAIKLRTLKIESNDTIPDDFELSYKREFLRLVQVFPEGATVEDMRRHSRLNRKLRNAKETATIQLEETEWEILLQKLTAARFSFYADEIIDMVDSVKNAAEVDAPHLSETGKKGKANAA